MKWVILWVKNTQMPQSHGLHGNALWTHWQYFDLLYTFLWPLKSVTVSHSRCFGWNERSLGKALFGEKQWAVVEPVLQSYSLIRPTETQNVMKGHYTLLIVLTRRRQSEEKGSETNTCFKSGFAFMQGVMELSLILGKIIFSVKMFGSFCYL